MMRLRQSFLKNELRFKLSTRSFMSHCTQRHHVHEKHGGPKSIDLKEVGPRFELRLYQDRLQWIRQFLALCCYTLLLMLSFIQVVYYYFFSSQAHRSVVYGEQPRNRLDLYIPTGTTGLKPVVAFATGGAWIIGYKGWGALLGRRLAEKGIIVACIDYRNFPQGTIGDMVEDASSGISFWCVLGTAWRI